MNKIWLLSLSNLRKSKGASLSLFLIIIIAAALLNLGILTSLNFSKAFDKRAEELNSAHVAVGMTNELYLDEFETYFSSYPGVTETQIEEIVFLSSAKFKYGKGILVLPTMFMNANTPRTLSILTLVEEPLPISDRDIYVPYILQSGAGYAVGDKFVINYREKDYSFLIAGFTEDILLGSTNVGGVGFYLPEDSYNRFQRELNNENTNGILLQSQLDSHLKSGDMINEFQKNSLHGGQTGFVSSVWLCAFTFAKNARTVTANIGALIITAFSLIIVLVSMIVIKFRVNTSIEDGMVDIGALKSLGYTSFQIIASIVLQFMLIAFWGSFFGISLSYSGVGLLSAMFSAQTGIIWIQGFDLTSSLISLILILASVLIITPISARRIKKLAPIIALRHGTTTHNFKKNICPLDHTKGSLNFVLALKSLMSNIKQNIMIAFIVAAVTFASVFGLVMYYNISENDKAFMDMVGVEMCTINITSVSGEATYPLIENLQQLDGVSKVLSYNFGMATINDEAAQVYITDDFSLLENNQIYEGRYPKYNNEISINGHMAEKFGKSIGDTLAVKMGIYEVEYIITGLGQGMNYMGMDLSITLEGSKQMQPNYQPTTINVYLEDGVDISKSIDDISTKFINQIVAIINWKDLAISQLGAYSTIVSIMATIILIITAFVVVLILYLVIKALLVRNRKILGIQKAIGYTTFQLMTQTALSFLPVVFIGALLGSVLGSLYINSLISILFKQLGVMKVYFVVPALWIGLMCVGICILSYVVSMLVSWRIRKITAYMLMVE